LIRLLFLRPAGGPRGLASIVLGLVYLEHELHNPGEQTIRIAIMKTVLCSILAHGLSAVPGIKLYSAKIKALYAAAPENQDPEATIAGG
jgi:sodium/hydrogen antiporter